MTNLVPDNFELERFAEYLGVSGVDTDLFYEAYYQLDSAEMDIEDYEEEEVIPTTYKS